MPRSAVSPVVSPALIGALAPQRLNAIQKGLAILRRYGANAHAYIPGIGSINGLVAGNYLDSALTTPATVDGLVGGIVDPLGAINATASGAARPVLRRGAVNLLTWSQTFGNAAWTVSAATNAENVTTAPDNTATADKVQEDATNANHYTGEAVTPTIGTYTYSVYLKAAERTLALLQLTFGGVNLFQSFNLSTGATGATTSGGVTASIVSAGNGWYRCIVTGATSSTVTGQARVWPLVTDNTATYTGIAGNGVYVWGAQLEIGSVASAYSPTTTTAASNANAGQYSAEYSGAQALTLGSVPFATADDYSVHVAASLAAAGTTRTIYGHSTVGGTQQICWIYFDATGKASARWFDGTTTVTIQSTLTYVGTPVVIRVRKVGTAVTLWVNGTQVASGSVAAIGTPAIVSAIIGALDSGTLPHLGTLGWVLPIKGTETDADGLTVDRLAASAFPNAPQF